MSEVLITGIGMVSPLGVGRAAVSAALAEGKSGIGDLTLFEPPGNCEHAAEVGDYDWRDYLFSKQTYADRCTQLAVGAARLALEDAGLPTPVPGDDAPVGLCYGTCWGCIASAEKFYEPVMEGKGRSASSLVFSHSYANSTTSLLAIELGLRGYSTSFSGSRLAGLWALRSAFDAIRSGAAAQILVGAAEALSPLVVAHCEGRGELPDTRGQTPPAAIGNGGADIWARVPGEGAVFLMLEADEAVGRGGQAFVLGAVSECGQDEAAPHAWHGGDLFAVGPLLRLAAGILGGADEITVSASDSSGGGGITARVAPGSR